MIISEITLTIDGQKWDVTGAGYKFTRCTDKKGRPTTGMLGGDIWVEFNTDDDDALLYHLSLRKTPPIVGSLEFFGGDDMICYRRINFEKAYLYECEESMASYTRMPMTTRICISPILMDINDVKFDRRWPETVGYHWSKREADERPVVVAKKEERITKIVDAYWIDKDGREQRDLDVDSPVTLYVDTENSQEGDGINLKFYDDKDQEISELSCSGVVNSSGVVSIEDFESNSQVTISSSNSNVVGSAKVGVKKRPLITSVTGEGKAIVGNTITYRVKEYSQTGISSDIKNGIKWAISLDGGEVKTTLTDKVGETIDLEIIEKWADKEIVVMPYLNKPTETVSTKTKVKALLIIFTSTEKEIFRLDGSSKNLYGKKYVKDIYSLGIQWFEPTADNYLPLKSVVSNITTYPELKHFTWDEIIKFAEKGRSMTAYRNKGDGDWKFVNDGASRYILVTVDGVPYWADAVGQIPFTIDCYAQKLESSGAKDEAKDHVIYWGGIFASGDYIDATLNIISNNPDTTNSYDNAMIQRALNWTEKRYEVTKEDGWLGTTRYRVIKKDELTNKLSTASNGEEIK